MNQCVTISIKLETENDFYVAIQDVLECAFKSFNWSADIVASKADDAIQEWIEEIE